MESEGQKNESEKSETATGPKESSNIAINPEECPKVNTDRTDNNNEFSEEEINFCACSSPESVVDDEPESCVESYSAESLEGPSRAATINDMELASFFMNSDDMENFLEFAWHSPHIFYRVPELPTKAHEDANMNNILLLATFSEKPLFCQLILNIFEHPQFGKRLFPFMPEDKRSLQIKRLIGYYLNSISTKTGDAPLQHASKFGLAECFKILISHPLCDRKLLKESGLSALHILDESGSPLNKLLTLGMQYVPIFRSNENLRPIVGKPMGCNDFQPLDYVQDAEMEPMGRKRSYFLSGFAGPMSFKMAIKFREALTEISANVFTPKEMEQILSIKQREPKRGLERIGRSLSEDWRVNWCEFFPFLEVYTNLATQEGLQVLEKYFDGRRKKLSYYRPLPSVDADPVTSILMLTNMFPILDNPLKHKANAQLCYYKKFLGVIKDVAEDDEISYNLSPLFGSQRSKQYNEKFINGSYLTELDQEMYISLKKFDDQYPHIQAWKREVEIAIEEGLRNNPNSMADNPLEPVPVPKVIIGEETCQENNRGCQCAECEDMEKNIPPSSPLTKRKKI